MLKGVDVARYQGTIDWSALKQAKDFAIIKATGGCPDPGEPDSKYLDSSFPRNRDEARRVGMLRGFYHYAYPEYNSPEAEAEYFSKVVSDLQPGELVVLDYESSWTGDAVDFCYRWLKKVEEKLGVKPLIYLNLFTTKSHNWQSVIDNGNGLWLAQWTYKDDGKYDASQPWPFAAFHQYSNREQVSGIPANVDGDVFAGDSYSFAKYGRVSPTPAPIPVPEPAPSDPRDQKIAELQSQIAELQNALSSARTDRDNALSIADSINRQLAQKILDNQIMSTHIENLEEQLKEPVPGSPENSQNLESLLRSLIAAIKNLFN